MTNCGDPCDECSAKSGKSQNCSCRCASQCGNEKNAHSKNCGCDKCKEKLKCSVICEKNLHGSNCSCPECQKVHCKVSCQNDDSSSKFYEVHGKIKLCPTD